MTIISAITAFLFIALAAIFGTNASSAPTELWPTALSILLFVAATSFVLGIVFGRTVLRITTLFGGLALFMMWLPLQLYATEESLIHSALFLLLTILVQALLFFVGGIVRGRIAIQLRGAD
jgi:hypothetical protein